MRIQHNSDSLQCAVHREREDRMDCEDKDGSVLTQNLSIRRKTRVVETVPAHYYPAISQIQLMKNPRTFKPFIVPSSGGVDTICYNNQGIMVY